MSYTTTLVLRVVAGMEDRVREKMELGELEDVRLESMDKTVTEQGKYIERE